PGRPAGPRVEPPPGMCYGRVVKHKKKGRVERVEAEVVFGELPEGEAISTSYLERHNATDRQRNARKGRKTYRFSKDGEAHEAMTPSTMYGGTFGWGVRTRRVRGAAGPGRQRPPAMAAGWADHVWPREKWLPLPAVQH